MSALPILEVRNLHKSFGDVEILKGIDLDMAKGDVVCIIGSSGSGKTTLLRCLNMLEDFQQGSVRIDGQPIGYAEKDGRRVRFKAAEIAKQRALTGMAFQQFNLFPHMTALQNVTLGLIKAKRLPRDEAVGIAERWLDRVGMLHRRDHYPSQLSGGQQQRVAIARAIAMAPKLMLFDEVTSSLDPELVGEVLLTIKDLANDGMTMLLVTHEMRFAYDVADRIVFMDAGLVAEEGPPKDVFNAPKSKRLAEFLRSTSFG